MLHQALIGDAQYIEQLTNQETSRCLWSHAAFQIISALSLPGQCERIALGAGWGLRHSTNHRRALLVHPTAQNHQTGDLALTVIGSGTHVIPRCGQNYLGYLAAVADIVETTARTYFDQ